MTAIVAALLVSAAALRLNVWLVRADRAVDLITPEPQRVVQSFVGALAAHRPESARGELAEDVRDAVEVRRLDAMLRARHGDYRFAGAETSREGEAATVRATLDTARDGPVEQRFRLARDRRTRL